MIKFWMTKVLETLHNALHNKNIKTLHQNIIEGLAVGKKTKNLLSAVKWANPVFVI